MAADDLDRGTPLRVPGGDELHRGDRVLPRMSTSVDSREEPNLWTGLAAAGGSALQALEHVLEDVAAPASLMLGGDQRGADEQ
jgi:hypothetical protein